MIKSNISIASNIYIRSDPDIRRDRKYTEKIKALIAERKYEDLSVALLKIEADLWDSCASDELVAIIDRLDQKIKDRTILKDIIAKILKIGLHIYRAIKIGAISFENFGDVLGRILFTLLSDKTPE